MRDKYKIKGKGKITLWEEKDGKRVTVKEVPIKGNTIMYHAGFFLLSLIEASGGGYDTIKCIAYMSKMKLGSDTVTASARDNKSLVSDFTPVIEVNFSPANEQFRGTVIEETLGGSHTQIFYVLTVTFGVGTFDGTQTIGEVGIFIETGITAGTGKSRAGITGVLGSGNTSEQWLMIVRISVADGDFSAIQPTVAQGVTVTYEISL